MRRRSGAAVAAIALAVLTTFALLPLVHTTTRPPIDQLAFLGAQPATESLSCAVFGVGTGYWQTATPSDPHMGWSYQIGCPPSSSTPGGQWNTASCSASVTIETTSTFFPYFTQTTTYAVNGTTTVIRTLTAGGTVAEYSNHTSTTCG
jgi:hypothetical protein